LEALLRLEKDQSFHFGILDVVDDRLITFAHVGNEFMDVLEWSWCYQIYIRVVALSTVVK